jgi:hypothetical protein
MKRLGKKSKVAAILLLAFLASIAFWAYLWTSGNKTRDLKAFFESIPFDSPGKNSAAMKTDRGAKVFWIYPAKGSQVEGITSVWVILNDDGSTMLVAPIQRGKGSNFLGYLYVSPGTNLGRRTRSDSMGNQILPMPLPDMLAPRRDRFFEGDVVISRELEENLYEVYTDM